MKVIPRAACSASTDIVAIREKERSKDTAQFPGQQCWDRDRFTAVSHLTAKIMILLAFLSIGIDRPITLRNL